MTATRGKKLTARWPDRSHDISCSILSSTESMASSVPRTGLKEVRTNWPWNWRLCLKQSRWCWSDHRMTSFKLTVGAGCAVLLIAPLPVHPWNSPLKPLSPNQQLGDGLGDASPSSPQVAGFWNKASFLFYQPCLSNIVFWATSSQTWVWFWLWLVTLLAAVCWGLIITMPGVLYSFYPHHPAKQALSSPFYRWENWDSD